ncbi:YcnI family copper-binding membrane protein [Streptomyces lydicus]|uniref:YcnI family copper-binding membrane protein n=1 Tax=Streptomyces lydicus TaxID=47763 RepID=UPI00068B366A|nr:YcnI family protein [Streptomyces lydicus]MDC7337901.1 YcnI family protein [Streptomyces lydicus]UEG92695.1 YcnI family protein [Streptomyces lydicus]
MSEISKSAPSVKSAKSPRVSRLALVGGVAAGSVLLLAGPAFAHVSVQSQSAPKGGFATVNFKVPNERDDASTVKLEVNLPTDHPLASVMPQPVPGWKVSVTKTKLAKPIEMEGEKINEAPSKITWTADGKGIEPGQFQQFPLSVGQLPENADQLVFKALQTYDNKDVVRWIEPTKEGAPEPENPAPVLHLTAAEGDGHGAAAGDDAKTTAAAAETSASDTTARVLGVVGIVVGIIGVGFGVFAGRRRSA